MSYKYNIAIATSEDVIYNIILNNVKSSPFLESCDIFKDLGLKECCARLLEEPKKVDFKEAAKVKQQTNDWLNLRRLRITGKQHIRIKNRNL